MPSKAQLKILWGIHRSLETTGDVPTLQELADIVGLKSKTTIRNHLIMLENLGYLYINRGEARGINLLERFIEEEEEWDKINFTS